MNDQPKLTFFRGILSFLRRYFLVCVAFVVLLCIAFAYESGRSSVYTAHPELASVEQAKTILGEVGKLIQLPTDEQPTMATINDAGSAKKSQPFLGNAINGDILIVYPTTKEAILYRPSTHKLIAVGPVNNGAIQQVPVVPQATIASSTNATTTKASR